MRLSELQYLIAAALLGLFISASPSPARTGVSSEPRGPVASGEVSPAEMAEVQTLVETGRWAEALESVRALSERAPGGEEVRLLLGDCLLLNFRALEAAEQYGAVPASSKRASAAVAKRATALVAAGRVAEALAGLDGARAAGVVLTEGALALQARLAPEGAKRLAALRELASRRPEDGPLRSEVRVWEAMEDRLAGLATAPASSGFGATKLKEIFREPALRVEINGKVKWLALDTGSEALLLNDDTADKLKLPVLAGSETTGWGVSGPRKTRTVFVDRLEVAGRTLRGVPAAINRRDSEFRTNKSGYLGLGLFMDSVVLYDRRNGAFSLSPPGTTYASLLRGVPTVLPMLWSRGLPLVPVYLQGRGPYPFLLDTGAPFTLLDSKHAAVLGIRINSGKYANFAAEGMSGAFSSGVAEQVALGVAGVHYDRPVILLTEVPQEFCVPVWGILGRDLLRDFAVVFDGPAARAAFLKYPN